MSKGLTVQQALEKAELIDRTLAAFIQTAPNTLGTADALVQVAEMTVIGPIPRLDAATWEKASMEYEKKRWARHAALA
ncbi:hypothetical protein LJR039_005022 [Pseudorhodoferax sp. LjRoot39]|uniref:hypothetical protein n=1 Tax=Pseudorhodoferax sp. LjRoot39 TaxID=3342328 RepID=UPI003ECFB46C